MRLGERVKVLDGLEHPARLVDLVSVERELRVREHQLGFLRVVVEVRADLFALELVMLIPFHSKRCPIGADRAAEIAGVGDQLGSIEPGKIADLVVSDGPALAENARIRTVFVDGIDYDVMPASGAGRTGQRAGAGGGRGGEVAQVAGTWVMTVSGPQGAMTSTLTLTQSADAIDGSIISEFGTATISDGRVNGRNVSWQASFQIGGERTTVSFEAEVDGNRMTGRARVGEMAPMTFTAEKRP